VASRTEKLTEISSWQNMNRESKAEGRDEGSALAMAHVPNTTSTETTTFSSATRNSPPNPAQRRIMVRAKLLQFVLCKGDFSEYFVQHMARLLGLDRMSPLMTTCSHVPRKHGVVLGTEEMDPRREKSDASRAFHVTPVEDMGVDVESGTHGVGCWR
jgi:hypothetical protein